jgi:selenocysteine-specific elongation factor
MHTIGTLGHVDHGKSTLIRALTGIDPDRLIEEQRREMTIDLGFAWLTLPTGETIGIVDVPGHRDFIENMLTGVTGVQAVMLIIAADEGVMPQTREHIAIAHLLNIRYGIIVLTKIDMIEDREWLSLIESEVRATVAGTAFANSAIISVSARTGENLPQLVQAIEQLTAQMPPQVDTGTPLLAIDRVFTMHGFGTVVTGTLHNGALHTGEEIEVQPTGLRSRIRTIQTHRERTQTALPGNRVALNLPGIHHLEIKRGNVVARPKALSPTQRIDVLATLLSDAPTALQHNSVVKLFIGTNHTEARVRILGEETIDPGEEGWLQLEFKVPIVASKGDHFVLRQPSPSVTIGGGIVVNPQPLGRHRRFKGETIADLQARLHNPPHAQLAQMANTLEPIKRAALAPSSSLISAEFECALDQAVNEGLIVELLPGAFMSAARIEALQAQIQAKLTQFHNETPLKLGLSQELLRASLGLTLPVFNAIIMRTAHCVMHGGIVALAQHKVTFTLHQEEAIARFMTIMDQTPFTPPSYSDGIAALGQDIIDALIATKRLIKLSPEIIIAPDAYTQLVAGALQIIDHEGEVTVAKIRDHFSTTRKYALALLEHLDTEGITKRIGDVRLRGHKA